MAPKLGKAPKELAEGLYFLASSGLTGKRAMDALVVSAKASAAGLGETEVVADAVSSAMNAYATTNLTAARAGDILVATVREGKGEASAIAPVIGNLLPLASELGVGFEEVGGSLAQMTRVGMGASNAATNLAGVMNSLLKPTVAGDKALKEVGLSFGGLRTELKEKGVISVLETVMKAFDGNTESIAKVFPNIRALRGLLALVGQAGGSTQQVFDAVASSTGSLDHAFQTAAEGSSFKFKQGLAELQVAGIDAGNALLPAAGKIVAGIGSIARAFNELPSGAQNAVLVIAGLAALAGPVMTLGSAFMALRTAFIAFSASIGAAAGPLGLFLAVAGLAAGAIALFAGSSRSGASAADQLAAASDRARTSMQSLRDAALALDNAQLQQRQSKLELRAANEGLRQVQDQVNSGQLKGAQASTALTQAELRVAQAKLGVRSAANEVVKANREEVVQARSVTRSNNEAVAAAKKRLAEAKAAAAFTPSSVAAQKRVESAARDLNRAERNLSAATREKNQHLRNTMGAGQRGAGGNFAMADSSKKAKGPVRDLAGVVNGLKAAMAGAAGAAHGSGAAIAQGLAAGIRSGAGAVQAAVNHIVSIANQAARAKAKISSPSKVFMDIGEKMSMGMALGVKKGKPKVRQVITNVVEGAIREAKQALTSMGRSIASTLGEAMDESARRRISVLGTGPEAQRLDKIQRELDAEEKAHQEHQLRQRIVEAENEADRAEANRDLTRFLLQQEADRLQDSLSLAEDQINRDVEARKRALELGLDNLTDMLNRGVISQAEFAQLATALIEAQAPEYKRVGSLLGEAAGRGFADAWSAMLTQAGLVNAFGQTPGSGADMGFLDPRRAAKEELLEVLNQLTGRATSPSSPGGKNITKAEKVAIDNVRARIKALGIAKGGIVGGPGGMDRAGLFRLTRGEGVFRTSAMEGMQRFFEKGSGRQVVVNFHGPVIGGGDRRALGRELASIIEPELNRRVAL
jgi:TP901 family phage tail tape measure protein